MITRASAGWVEQLRRPRPLPPNSGCVGWLSPGGALGPRAPASCYAARGAGSNVIWIDPEHDLVVVVRWIDKASLDGFLKLVVESATR